MIGERTTPCVYNAITKKKNMIAKNTVTTGKLNPI